MDASDVSGKSLADVLGARARRTPVDRLVLDVVGGLLIGAAAVWARPPAWFPLLAAALCFACYGGWALTERRLHPDISGPVSPAGPAWRALRHVAAVLGVAAYVTLLFAVLGLALGPIKS